MPDVNPYDIGGGISNFFGGLLKVKRMGDEDEERQAERDFKERQLAMDAARYGLLRGEDGSYSQSPEAEDQKKFKQRMLNMGMERDALELEKLRRENSPEGQLQSKFQKESGETRGKIGNVADAYRSLTNIGGLLKKGEGPKYLDANTPLIGGLLSDTPFTVAQRQLSEVTGRLQSGGQMNDKEVKIFREMGPRPGDSPEIAAQKVEEQRRFLDNKLRGLGYQPEDLAKLGFHSEELGIGGGQQPMVAKQDPELDAPMGLLPTARDSSVAAPQRKMTPRDQQMINEAKKHPNDPDAQAVLKHWGIR